MIGSRPRIVYNEDGLSICLIIRRLRCCECGRVHHELPDSIVPYKRHDTKCIAMILSGSHHPCEISSALRLRIWFVVLKQAVSEMLRLPSEVFQFNSLIAMSRSNQTEATETLLKFLVKQAANDGKWIFPPLSFRSPDISSSI